MIKIGVIFSTFEIEKQLKERLKNELDIINDIPNNNIKPEFINSIGKSEQFYKTENESTALTILIIATGGTEQFAERIISNLNHPVLLFANSSKNSFAASLEIYAYLKESHFLKLFYYQNIPEFKQELENFISVNKTLSEINEAKIGIIGEPSDWLLSSKNISTFGNFKTELTRIKIESLTNLVDNEIAEDSKSKITQQFSNINVSQESILYSAKVYDALKQMVKEYSLSALTVRCFDLLEYKYTACMALSYLNDNGIVSGCEGDLPALFTMMVAQKLTGAPVWMANPARVNKKENILTLAHCTIPTSMLDNFNDSNLSTHMESDLSTAIQGPLKRQKVTILRFGDNFNKLIFSTGRIIDTNMNDPELCRTQVKIVLDNDLNKWIDNSLGNHQILVYGDISDLLKDFCKYSGIELLI